MRKFFGALAVTTCFLFSAKVLAYGCPKRALEEGKGKQLYEWIHKFKGAPVFANCEVEVVLCEETEEVVDGGPAAEIYLKHSSGREAYLPLVLPSVETPKLYTKIQVNKRMLHYELFDKFYEADRGRTEVSRLEILTEWDDQGVLKSLDLGVYSTHYQLNQANGNDSEWFNCGQ